LKETGSSEAKTPGVKEQDVTREKAVWNADFAYTVTKGEIIFPRFDIAKELAE
jgi:hypothetical protein